MRIDVTRPLKRLDDLNIGDTFLWKNEVFMCIENCYFTADNNYQIIVVNLKDGSTERFERITMVEPIKLKVQEDK